MSEIPEDVWAEACRHFDTMEKSQEIPMLCRAILAERKRCAEIARKYIIHGHAYATANGIAIVKEIEAGA